MPTKYRRPQLPLGTTERLMNRFTEQESFFWTETRAVPCEPPTVAASPSVLPQQLPPAGSAQLPRPASGNSTFLFLGELVLHRLSCRSGGAAAISSTLSFLATGLMSDLRLVELSEFFIRILKIGFKGGEAVPYWQEKTKMQMEELWDHFSFYRQKTGLREQN